MSHKEYGHRDVLDKLGIKPGHAVAIAAVARPLDDALGERALGRSGRSPAGDDEPTDVVLATADGATDAVALLEAWKPRLQPNGGIWLLTPKRGQPGYVDQREMI